MHLKKKKTTVYWLEYFQLRKAQGINNLWCPDVYVQQGFKVLLFNVASLQCAWDAVET